MDDKISFFFKYRQAEITLEELCIKYLVLLHIKKLR